MVPPNTNLEKLKDQIPILLKAGYASSTWDKYSRSWGAWKDWCGSTGIIDICPASNLDVALYLTHIFHSRRTRGALDDAFNGIRWAHEISDFTSPTSSVFVKKVLEGAKRLCEKKSNQKDPLQVSHLVELFEAADSECLKDLRFLLIITLSFAGFLRISELIALKVGDIELHADFMTILVKKSKCDQLREGEHVYISQSGRVTCPLALTRKYLLLSGLGESKSNVLIGRMQKISGHKYTISGKTPLSYTRIREIILEGTAVLRERNPNLNIGTHSCRVGGATAAAAGGASDRLLGKHGRWKSNKSRNRYVKDSVTNRLSVTKAMNL